jgi:hypothetical protein
VELPQPLPPALASEPKEEPAGTDEDALARALPKMTGFSRGPGTKPMRQRVSDQRARDRFKENVLALQVCGPLFSWLSLRRLRNICIGVRCDVY